MKIDAKGFERTPPDGPMLIVTNHSSVWEGLIVFALIPRDPVSPLAKKEWQGKPQGVILDIANAIYVTRGEVDRAALKEILRRLKQGAGIGIAPEGTRSEGGKLLEAKEGVAYIALQSGATILPIAIWGQEKALAEWIRLRRPRVFVRVGKPFRLESATATDRQENMQAGTRRIMHAIARMMPPDYRGFYADEVTGEAQWD
ncbi:MAG: lysophospholipid acyltransferase family protein [Ardenticatenaceae bacterium]